LNPNNPSLDQYLIPLNMAPTGTGAPQPPAGTGAT